MLSSRIRINSTVQVVNLLLLLIDGASGYLAASRLGLVAHRLGVAEERVRFSKGVQSVLVLGSFTKTRLCRSAFRKFCLSGRVQLGAVL